MILAGQVTAQTFTTLHSFTGTEGAGPIGLILGANRLYGATRYSSSFSPYGTVFSLNKNGTGFTNLYRLSSSDGWYMNGGLVLTGNALFGTAAHGGTNGNGTVFALNTGGTGFTNE